VTSDSSNHETPETGASTSTGRRHLVTNATTNALAFIVTVAVTFYVAPILVHGLGDRRYGMWSLVESVLAYLALADFGIGAAVLRFVARFEGLKNADKVNRVFSTSIALLAAGGTLVLLATLGLAFLWGSPLGAPEDLVTDVRWLLVLLGVNLGSGLPLGTYGTVLSGLGRYPTRNLIKIAWLLVRSAALVIAMHHQGGIPAVALIITACGLGENLFSAVAAHYYLPSLRFSPRLIDRDTFGEIGGYSAFVFVALIAGRITYQTDAMVIAWFLTPEHITFFMIAGRLVRTSRQAIRSVVVVLAPAVSRWDAIQNSSAIRRAMLAGTRYSVYLIVPIQIGLLMLGYPFLTLWMGPRYAELSYPTLAILAVPIPLSAIQLVAVRMLHGTGKVRALAGMAVVEAGTNLALSIALVGRLGIEGVALGTAVPHAVYCLAVLTIGCRAAGVSVGRCTWNCLARPAPAAALLVAVWAAARWYIPETTWPTLIVTVAGGLVVYFAAVALLEPDGRRLFRRIAARGTRGAAVAQPAEELPPTPRP